MARGNGAVLGVYREQAFSPGKVSQDRAVLDATLEELRDMGYPTSVTTPDKLDKLCHRPMLILSMAQSFSTLNILAWLGADGTTIVNSVSSVRTCYRIPLFSRLKRLGIPIPKSRVLPSSHIEATMASCLSRPFWLKRPDVHAMEAGDVVKIMSAKELNDASTHFLSRTIDHVLVQDHVEGEVFKFYGLGQGSYFAAFHVTGTRQIPTKSAALREIAERAAAGLGLEVYGGDAVLDSSGRFHLIDINDWPSFSPCWEEAAQAIAIYSARLINDPAASSRVSKPTSEASL